MTKKKKQTKEYSSDQVKAVFTIRKTTNHSIRSIAKMMGIPKSVVGRWVKHDPDDKRQMKYIRKYDFRDVKRKVKTNMSKKDLEIFMNMENRILHAPIATQSELTVEWYDDYGTYSVGYLD